MQNLAEKIGLAILAGGEGKRLKTKETKVLVPLLGKKLLDFPLMTAKNFVQENKAQAFVGVVTGKFHEDILRHLQKENLDFPWQCVEQKEPKGTADALKTFFSLSEAQKTDYTFVLCGDTPLITESHLKTLWEHLQKNSSLQGVVASFHLANPTGYGRIKRAEKVGFHIVEEKEASLEEKKIKEVNSGLYLLRTSFLLQELKKISAQNKAHEFYLTDLFKAGISVDLCVFDQADDFQGVNDLKQLEEVESLLLKRKKQSLQEQGVRFLHSPSVIIDWDVKISAGTQIHAGVELRGKTVVAGDVIIESGCIIKNSCIEKSAVIKAYSYIEEAQVGSFATVGPFARLRAETFIGEFAKIGNFVELKKVKLHKGVKISHLSYVGDAEVGENTNIGCGFITCNYDGAEKHFSEIGADTFIGSDTQLIAPIKIGNKVYIASGSTINQDIPDEGFAIARTRQVTKEKMSSRFIKNKNNT